MVCWCIWPFTVSTSLGDANEIEVLFLQFLCYGALFHAVHLHLVLSFYFVLAFFSICEFNLQIKSTSQPPRLINITEFCVLKERVQVEALISTSQATFLVILSEALRSTNSVIQFCKMFLKVPPVSWSKRKAYGACRSTPIKGLKCTIPKCPAMLPNHTTGWDPLSNLMAKRALHNVSCKSTPQARPHVSGKSSQKVKLVTNSG
jgi:hypothetical protein